MDWFFDRCNRNHVKGSNLKVTISILESMKVKFVVAINQSSAAGAVCGEPRGAPRGQRLASRMSSQLPYIQLCNVSPESQGQPSQFLEQVPLERKDSIDREEQVKQ
jgi:hypothetical protein